MIQLQTTAACPTFFNSGTCFPDEPKKADSPPPPLPEFSPRSELVRLAVKQGTDGFLPHSYVNRLWARLIGRGLVHPLDQMHSGNPPSHPELLNALAHDCVAHSYDARRLIRAIVLSEVYARDSHWGEGERPLPDLFAVATVRPLTPRQLALSLDIATLAPAPLATAIAGEGWMAQREQLEAHSVAIDSRLELPEDGFQVSVDEALLFSNGSVMADEYLRITPLVGRILTADGRRLQTSRKPVGQELAESSAVGVIGLGDGLQPAQVFRDHLIGEEHLAVARAEVAGRAAGTAFSRGIHRDVIRHLAVDAAEFLRQHGSDVREFDSWPRTGGRFPSACRPVRGRRSAY